MIMSDLIIFTPKDEKERSANFSDFITFVKENYPLLNEKIDYESYYWPKVGNFTKTGISNQDRAESNRLHKSIIPFAKAYVTYTKSHNSAKNTNQLYALRAIEAACIKAHGKVDMPSLKPSDFDRAAQVARENMGEGAAYQAGTHLKKLHTFLIDKKIIEPFLWKSPIKKPKEMGGVGDDADKRREQKMPDENALMALAAIFAQKNQDLTPRDIFTTSTMALLMCAPERGSEPIYLKSDCLDKVPMTVERAIECGYTIKELNAVVQARIDARKDMESGGDSKDELVSLESGDTIELYALKWFSGKGYGHANKWIPSAMMDTAAKAVERLLEQSRTVRDFAKKLEETRNFPRHELCPDVNEEKLLTKEEAVNALGLDMSLLSKRQCQVSGNQLLKKIGIEYNDFQVNLSDLNKIIRSRLPKGFPYIPFKNGQDLVKVKWSESLYAQFANALHARKSTILTEFVIPTINTLNEDLAPTKKKNRSTGTLASGNLSIFERWDYSNLNMTSHQARHMLDTIADVNGMDGEVRAKWAQRADPKHNRFYEHATHEEYGEDFIANREKQIAMKDKSNEIDIQWHVATPRTIQELNTKASLTAHIGEMGICEHSYLSEPCYMFRDCINCPSLICEKGNKKHRDKLQVKLKREEKLFQKDKRAIENEVNGAIQWFKRREVTVDRCKQLLTLMDNTDIEDGALIRLADVEGVSALDRALDANNKKRLPKITNYKRVHHLPIAEFLGG